MSSTIRCCTTLGFRACSHTYMFRVQVQCRVLILFCCIQVYRDTPSFDSFASTIYTLRQGFVLESFQSNFEPYVYKQLQARHEKLCQTLPYSSNIAVHSEPAKGMIMYYMYICWIFLNIRSCIASGNLLSTDYYIQRILVPERHKMNFRVSCRLWLCVDRVLSSKRSFELYIYIWDVNLCIIQS